MLREPQAHASHITLQQPGNTVLDGQSGNAYPTTLDQTPAANTDLWAEPSSLQQGRPVETVVTAAEAITKLHAPIAETAIASVMAEDTVGIANRINVRPNRVFAGRSRNTDTHRSAVGAAQYAVSRLMSAEQPMFYGSDLKTQGRKPFRTDLNP